MAVLTWDGTGEKYFETGVSKGVLEWPYQRERDPFWRGADRPVG